MDNADWAAMARKSSSGRLAVPGGVGHPRVALAASHAVGRDSRARAVSE